MSSVRNGTGANPATVNSVPGVYGYGHTSVFFQWPRLHPDRVTFRYAQSLFARVSPVSQTIPSLVPVDRGVALGQAHLEELPRTRGHPQVHSRPTSAPPRRHFCHG